MLEGCDQELLDRGTEEQIDLTIGSAGQTETFTGDFKVNSKSTVWISCLDVTDYSTSLTANVQGKRYTGVAKFSVFRIGVYAFRAIISPDIMYSALSTMRPLWRGKQSGMSGAFGEP